MNSNKLHNLTVIVTRPLEQGKALCAAVQASGGHSLAQPLLRINSTPITHTMKTYVQQLESYQHIIAISTNAVQYSMSLLCDYWPQWPIDSQWYAVGKSTASALDHYHVGNILSSKLAKPNTTRQHANASTNNSEALLELPQLQKVNSQKILILKGEGGRALLEETLIQRGASVDCIESYQRSPVEINNTLLHEQLNNSSALIITISSATALKQLYEQASSASINIQATPLLVISKRLADIAKGYGFQHIVISDSPYDACIIKALAQWHQRTRHD